MQEAVYQGVRCSGGKWKEGLAEEIGITQLGPFRNIAEEHVWDIGVEYGAKNFRLELSCKAAPVASI